MTKYTESERKYMSMAFELAQRVKGSTSPNPAVGAVVVNQNRIVGQGATDLYGGPHAEKQALQQAGQLATGATLFVTLEPCNHFGKTPPCTQTIVDANIKKVIIATKDPNPLVNGKGIRFLRRRKIEVSVGLMGKEIFPLNEDFFWYIQNQRPWITIKLALTLDGKIADQEGNSQWITNKESRVLVHTIRSQHSVIAVGSGTLEKDDPQLTVRHVKGVSPVRMVFSSKGNIKENLKFRKTASKIRSVIVSSGGNKGDKIKAKDGTEYWYTGAQEMSAHLQNFMEMAFDEGFNSILIEGGQKLASLFLAHKLVNRIYFFYGNTILGSGLNGISLPEYLTIKNSLKLKDIKIKVINDNVMVTGIPQWSGEN